MKNTIRLFTICLLLLLPLSSFAAGKPRVLMQTSMGNIVLELYPNKAPKTVANFLEYVRDGFYNGTIFHRVISNFMIQGGGFTVNYKRKQTRPPIMNEADNGLKNLRGTIAMARTFEPQSATAQFFINVVNNPFLDHKNDTPRGWGYCVFGKVVKGMKVVDKIRNVPTGQAGPFSQNAPLTPVVIKKMTVIAPAHASSPDKTAAKTSSK